MSLHIFETVQQLVLAQATSAGTPQLDFSLTGMVKSIEGFGIVVAGILAIMSVYSLGVVAERIFTYSRANRASRRFLEALQPLLKEHQFEAAIELAKKEKVGHLPRVLGLAIGEYKNGLEALRSKGPHDVGHFDIIDAVNRAIERSSLRTVNELRRGLGALATIGSTAPFVGLLGTVWGIIKAFQKMAIEGGGGLGTVSGAIAEALINTAFGLLVAIPAVMFFNNLTNRVEEMQVDITDSATELVDFFMKEGR
ncbi:MAG: MotA/TolQ/ExbB proton channel family protein [Anaeromyxobacter sp.]|nr:MotA/TolQ/ExbB proton channel family protein [Anaeromyxobacter sp.]MBL0275333.1 MotA/TolQ/ExbB proton channel family protein [Anaeromyxobacter sp.]